MIVYIQKLAYVVWNPRFCTAFAGTHPWGTLRVSITVIMTRTRAQLYADNVNSDTLVHALFLNYFFKVDICFTVLYRFHKLNPNMGNTFIFCTFIKWTWFYASRVPVWVTEKFLQTRVYVWLVCMYTLYKGWLRIGTVPTHVTCTTVVDQSPSVLNFCCTSLHPVWN